MTDRPVAGVVVAAGSSRRLGRPKQLLAYRGRTLLDATLDVARAAPFAQRIVTLGGAADQIRGVVDLDGFTVVEAVRHTEGCSSSIISAVAAIEPDAAGMVMLLGDQPGIAVSTIEALVAATPGAPIGVCRYRDGIGHPFWFGREVFTDLTDMHGDKAVWKLIESDRYPVTEVEVPTPIPLDVDTWEDYERLMAATGT